MANILMKISEIFLIVFIMTLFIGVYFFVQKKIINPPEKKIETVIQLKVDVMEQQMGYYEKNADKLTAREEKKIKKMQKEIDAAKPYIKQAEDYYQKEYGYILKLPLKQQEKEMKKLVEKKRKETEKYKKYLPSH
ncbi:MAG: hypothetical protein HY919_00790 [Elusimicrobia bacterium]|nr:hypothetical protein [Elusimicrobiota bacterium]